MSYKKPVGVADNKSYKDMYHFTNTDPSKSTNETPSINDELKINDSIKENPYTANVEIEKDEVVLQPDLSGLFLARGKTHKKGGIDVTLKPESFIYSNDKSLALTPEECELYEFKKGGTTHKPENYTPAQVVRKNVDPKDYNRLVSNITDTKKGELAKKSSALMLDKYIETLGQVAYIQENKKNFPQGMPAISEGTAPVFHPELEALMDESVQYANGTEIKDKYKDDKSKQYVKYGGTVGNPYMQGGGLTNPQGSRIEGSTKGWKKIAETDQYIQYERNGQVRTVPKNGPQMSDPDWIEFKRTETPEHKANRLRGQQGSGRQYGFTLKPVAPMYTAGETDMTIGQNRVTIPGNLPTPQLTNIPGPQVPNINATPQGYKRADWEFTPWQKLSQGYNLYKLASARREFPMRSQVDSPLEDPYLVNPEQTVGDLKGISNQNINSLKTLNPILRNAQAASIYGQIQNQIPEVRNQYDNTNQQIVQGVRARNVAAQTRDEYKNKELDQQYYQQTVVGRQNFANMKSYLGDQYMNNVMRDVETNQSLAYNLLSQDNPAYDYDWKTGHFMRNQKSILDAKSNPQGDYIQSILGGIDFQSLSNAEKIQLVRELQRGKALQYLQPGFPPAIGAQSKKGGIMTRRKKKPY